ncbi:MAG: acyl-CoA desaturase [Cyanobacteria bacterium P01_E01_bin.45]
MNDSHRMSRILIDSRPVDPCVGRVKWSPVKSLWLGGMYTGAVLAVAIAFSWSGFILFGITSILTLCIGHSVGMHRRLIHYSFGCPLWLERLMVYTGTLIGLAGPFSIIAMHEMRDWAQRQPRCHDYFASRRPLLLDWFWILNCDIHLERAPTIQLEQRVLGDRVYWVLERTRYLQQLPWALAFYAIGGWSWVLWGSCMRVSVCMTGHWFVGYVAHRWGQRSWHIDGAGVQGYNVRFCGLLTMGECWHNIHHAYPDAAQMGLTPTQFDPGWWLIQGLEILGLAWDVVRPEDLPVRPERQALLPDAGQLQIL